MLLSNAKTWKEFHTYVSRLCAAISDNFENYNSFKTSLRLFSPLLTDLDNFLGLARILKKCWNFIKMSWDFNFTVTSWFLGNFCIKPYFNTQCPPPSPPGKNRSKPFSIWNPEIFRFLTALRLGTLVKQWGAKYLRIEFQGENSQKISYDISSVQ